MRIAVDHSTRYRYDSAVYQEPHTFRLRPREDGAQHLLRFDLQIEPRPAGSTECLDQDGNVVVEAWFNEPLQELSVRSAFEIETLRANPFDFHLSCKDFATLPLVYPGAIAASLGPYLGAGQDPEVVLLAQSVQEETGGRTLDFLTALNRRIFGSIRYESREQGPPHSPQWTLSRREGSCRDMAVLFCAACRCAGIAARFVSGYEREAAFQESPEMHAWAEVYLPGGGWRGYDPSQGLATYTAHISVAAAAEPSLASPVSGTFRGAAKASMEFQIAMRVEA